jgi:membrane-associated protease RseP (regulator of RpoE activity)
MDDVYVRAPPRTRFPTIHVVLFLATVASTLWTGFGLALIQTGATVVIPVAGGMQQVVAIVRAIPAIAWVGLPFSATLVGILFTHEMGHYFLARRHGVDATLPFFIPAPMVGVGTLGAVIRIRSLMPSRKAVLDIGVAGPIAGFVLAVPLLLWGYAHSPVAQVEPASAPIPSLLNYLRHWLGALPSPTPDGGAITFGRSVVTMAALKLTHPGLPVGAEVTEHPVAIAAWFGMLVTSLNLIPIGQLDGGHLLYALLGGERARRLSRAVSWALFVLGITVAWSWLVWWGVTRVVVGNRHPPALDEAPLDPGRRLVAVLGLVMFAVTFMPVPLH